MSIVKAGARVAEFEAAAPTPRKVVTVTINPVVDQTLTIPNFTAGTVNRVRSSQLDPGGKGINVASCLADFGERPTVTGFLGDGNDEIFRHLFERKGIKDRFVRIPGRTRIGVKISDDVLKQTTDINFPGLTPGPAAIEQFFTILRELAATHEWFVLSGSIPAGVSAGIYSEMVEALAGKKTVLDTSGEGFRLAVARSPWMIKPNLDELGELVGEKLATNDAIIRVARELMEHHGISTVVVSMGKEGAIFIEGPRAVWAVPAPVEVKSTVGAGDAMVAGIVVGNIEGLCLAECARLATAFSMTAVSHIGSGLHSIEAVQAARETVTIHEL